MRFLHQEVVCSRRQQKNASVGTGAVSCILLLCFCSGICPRRAFQYAAAMAEIVPPAVVWEEPGEKTLASGENSARYYSSVCSPDSN